MKVLVLATNETIDYLDCYAARLIEQGRAILPVPKKKEKKAAAVKAKVEIEKE